MSPMNKSAARAATGLGALAIATSIAVVPATAQTDAQGTAPTTTSAATTPVTAKAAAAPRKRSAKLRIRSARRNVVAGQRVLVRGALRPAKAGKIVKLQVRKGKRWKTLDRTITRRGGAYRLHFTARKLGTVKVRIAFAGDRSTRAARRSVGRVTVYRKVLVSWYGGGGAVACPGASGRATYGVAHRTLPCGTKVKFRYRGRTVVAKVIDRGPFVSGREYDLTGETKNALGAGDLTTVMSSK